MADTTATAEAMADTTRTTPTNEVKLWCGVYNMGIAFSIDASLGMTVEDLQKEIVEIRGTRNVAFHVDPPLLKLYLARKEEGEEWLARDNRTKPYLRDGDPSGYPEMKKWNPLSTYFTENPAASMHVLVELPKTQTLTAAVAQLPQVMPLPDQLATYKEVKKFPSWKVDEVHQIPRIWKFMEKLGGCTRTGEIYWRREDRHVVSLLVKSWFDELCGTLVKDKSSDKCILVGSPGIGKSTILCVMAFYLALVQKQEVLVYRRVTISGQTNCVLYLGYKNGNLVYFSKECDEEEATQIYNQLCRVKGGRKKVCLLLDGFVYKDVPSGLKPFKLLATSQQVVLPPSDNEGVYHCLLSCWLLKDLKSLGRMIYKFPEDEMKDRFYYSGGSVREFTGRNVRTIQRGFDNALSFILSNSMALHSSSVIMAGDIQADWVWHTHFASEIVGLENEDSAAENMIFDALTTRGSWQHVIDSEYVLEKVRTRLAVEPLQRMYRWALGAGCNALVSSLAKIYLHRLADDDKLKIYFSTFRQRDHRKEEGKDYTTSRNYQPLKLLPGESSCSTTNKDEYRQWLEKWRDDDNVTYWSPACRDFENVDAIVKLVPEDGKKGGVAYLQMTVAASHRIDVMQLQKMNDIFYSEDGNTSGDAEKPMYIALCPSKSACEQLILTAVDEAKKICRVCVGYYASSLTSASFVASIAPKETTSQSKPKARSKGSKKRPASMTMPASTGKRKHPPSPATMGSKGKKRRKSHKKKWDVKQI